jgi:hypothetical protein
MTDPGRRLRKRLRREAHAEAMAAIAFLPDEDLRGMLKELGRELNAQIAALRELNSRHDAVHALIEQRRAASGGLPRVSDHAVLRFLERCKGVDVQAAREELVCIARRSATLGSGEPRARRVDAESGLTLGINEETNVVTTVFHEREVLILDVAGPET